MKLYICSEIQKIFVCCFTVPQADYTYMNDAAMFVLSQILPKYVSFSVPLSELYYFSLSNSANFAAIVGFPFVKRLIVRSSALLLANLRLFSEESKASFVF